MKTNGLHVVRMSQMNGMNIGKDSSPFAQIGIFNCKLLLRERVYNDIISSQTRTGNVLKQLCEAI
jgi:hypothetical protein